MAALPRLAADLLAWAGADNDRCHEALMAELAAPKPRDNVIAELRNRLAYPYPDTPPAEVLAWCRRPGFTPAGALAVERARPPRWQRPKLIAELEAIVAGQGDNASAVAPIRPDFKQLFR
jgi:hypothetical protein